MTLTLSQMQQAARYLGVTAAWINRHIHEIPHTKVGRFNKFRKSDLDRFRERNR